MRLSLLLVAALLICAAETQAAAPLFATLRVSISGISNAGGTLRVGIYDEATFPVLSDLPVLKREIARVAGDVAVVFDNVPPGTYAVRALQDVNNDGKAGDGEPQGISNGAERDNFDAAAITVMPGTNTAEIRLR